MMCDQCKSEVKLTKIDENYVAQGMCGKRRGDRHQKLVTDPTFDNLRIGHTEKSSSCCLEREFILMNTWTAGKNLKRTTCPQLKLFTVNSVCQELVSATTTTSREFGESSV